MLSGVFMYKWKVNGRGAGKGFAFQVRAYIFLSLRKGLKAAQIWLIIPCGHVLTLLYFHSWLFVNMPCVTGCMSY